MSDVINNVIGTALSGGDVAKTIVDAELPFAVDTPSDKSEAPANKLERILDRTQKGDVESVKRDPEFNAFLEGVVNSMEISNEVEDREFDAIDLELSSTKSMLDLENVEDVVRPNGP